MTDDDKTREKGFYFVELPWGKTIIAQWHARGWLLTGDGGEYETIYFSKIGDPVLLT